MKKTMSIVSAFVITAVLSGPVSADLNVQRTEKNEFSQASNQTIVFDGVKLSVPSYLTDGEDTDISAENNKYYYAEAGTAVAFLETMYTDLGQELTEDQFRSQMDDFDQGVISTLDNPEILSTLDVTVAGCPGRILHVFCNIQDMELEGYFTYFFRDEEDRVDVLSLCQTTNTEYSYFSDYYKIIATAELE